MQLDGAIWASKRSHLQAGTTSAHNPPNLKHGPTKSQPISEAKKNGTDGTPCLEASNQKPANHFEAESLAVFATCGPRRKRRSVCPSPPHPRGHARGSVDPPAPGTGRTSSASPNRSVRSRAHTLPRSLLLPRASPRGHIPCFRPSESRSPSLLPPAGRHLLSRRRWILIRLCGVLRVNVYGEFNIQSSKFPQLSSCRNTFDAPFMLFTQCLYIPFAVETSIN
ncbi:hypothetical protein GUJ93_ZPchr0003g17232 [Zizania palustris]|uniref:Uncharacterized protein n=1 Tax=Zizania palustris TaxID=103762 RepID=A0A8J5SHH4_ZIZPA|nr:hypothetical protein GUJ93_ZPchr0003g17232 [Zizania palustris]